MKTPRTWKKVYWAPVAPDGEIVESIMTELKSDAIGCLLLKPWRETMGKKWDVLRREGWRVIKVRVVPVEES